MLAEMSGKARVHAALRREPVDRVPVYMWFHPETAQRLAGLLGIPVGRLAEAMGDDVRQTWVNNNYAMEGVVHEQEGEIARGLLGCRVDQAAWLQSDHGLSFGWCEP